MPTTHSCPLCGHVMHIADRYAGRELFCTACSGRYVVPGEPPASCPGCGAALRSAVRFCPACGRVTGLVPPPLIRRPVAVSVLAVLYLIAAGLYALGAAALLLMPAQAGEGGRLAVSVVVALLAVLAAVVGVGLWRLRPWARRTAIALAVIGLLGFPVGTLVSAAILVYLFSGQAKVVFSGRRPDELGQAELAVLESRSSVLAITAAVAAVALVGIAILGIIAAIAVPNLINAIQRGREKRTTADMALIRSGLEWYAEDHGRYPADVESIDELMPHLEPAFVSAMPMVDGWSRPFEFRSDADGDSWELASLGRDGEPGPRPGGETTDFDADLVLDPSGWRQWPRGISRH